MATHSYGPGSTTPPNSGSPEWNHAYGIAALRAALIALALLAILAVIALVRVPGHSGGTESVRTPWSEPVLGFG